MPRYTKDLPTRIGYEQAGRIVNEYLTSEGFQYVMESGDAVWRKGVGAVTVPQFMKVLPGDGVVHIEAWLAGVAFLPGVYTGEMGLDGFWGFAIKAALRKRVEELERRLTAASPDSTADLGQEGAFPPPPPPVITEVPEEAAIPAEAVEVPQAAESTPMEPTEAGSER